MTKKIEILNSFLLIMIIIYQFFFLSINFRYDFIIVSIFFMINIKNIYNFIKKNAVNFFQIISIILFTLFLIIQAIILKNSNISVIETIYDYRYIIIYLVYPVLLFPTISSLNISDKMKNNLKLIYIISTYLICVYGIFTYIFNINLVQSGMHVLDGYTGRVSSFFGNPNAFAFLLLLLLIFFLYDFNINKKVKYSIIPLIVINICLTYGRYAYACMGLVIFVYLLYVIFNQNINQKILKISLIFILVYFTFYLPNNNYLYLSLLNKFEDLTSIKISKSVSYIIDKIVFLNDQTEKEVLNDRLESISILETSSEGTRKLFKNIALEIYGDNKLIGVGSLNYDKAFEEKLMEKNINYVNVGLPHDNYIYLLTNYGLIGTILYLTILISIFIYLIKSKNIIAISIFLCFIITNFMDDLMLKNFFPYILIALSLKMSYTKQKVRKVKK